MRIAEKGKGRPGARGPLTTQSGKWLLHGFKRACANRMSISACATVKDVPTWAFTLLIPELCTETGWYHA
jgi:hypothetical protein